MSSETVCEINRDLYCEKCNRQFKAKQGFRKHQISCNKQKEINDELDLEKELDIDLDNIPKNEIKERMAQMFIRDLIDGFYFHNEFGISKEKIQINCDKTYKVSKNLKTWEIKPKEEIISELYSKSKNLLRKSLEEGNIDCLPDDLKQGIIDQLDNMDAKYEKLLYIYIDKKIKQIQ